MQNIEEVMNQARKRAVEKKLPYSGELTPQETYFLLQQANAILVDVRSQAELDLVGRVPDATHIEWAFYPGMVSNTDFGAQLQAKVAPNKTVIFMCRTGARSHSAAVLAQQIGYSHAFNMLEGFEGEANAQKQRTLVNGWKQANLPWTN
ncbi:MAG: rhodanese-like domain-containing protein [Pseudomonadota bacterium]